MQKVTGNTDGIRRSYIDALEKIYDMEIDRKQFCSIEMLEVLSFFTGQTGREALVYIDRSGRIETIVVGEQDRVSLPSLRKRRSENRLSGIRCIHTHPGGNGNLSLVDIQSLKATKLDAMAAIGVVDGKPDTMQVGILDTITPDGDTTVALFGPYKAAKIPDDVLWEEIEAADLRIRPAESKRAEADIARAILVGLEAKEDTPLGELKQLADTAGFIIVGRMVQPKAKPDKSTYLGHGKLQELILEIQKLQADAIIFDDELSPAQLRNIQKELGKTELIDRTALILDIFSNRASTHEGRLQVELAQTKYLLPRMTGYWAHFTRMGGGGGGGGGARRGEGETQLEVDRRLLRKRLTELEREIDKVKNRREVQRIARERSKIPIVALVGYTNAGKSTLMNALSGSNVLSEDKLFATLEEAKYADLLLHVVDTSSVNRAQQMDVVNDVLTQLDANSNSMLMVYNKCDIVPDIGVDSMANGIADSSNTAGAAGNSSSESIAISAITGMGLDDLKAAITKKLSEMRGEISALLPLSAGGLVSRIYESGQVHECDYREDGIFINVTVAMEDASRIRGVALEIYD